jgi:carboxylesterase type B
VKFLRDKTTQDLVSAFKGHQFFPVLDGRVFPAITVQLYELREFNHCELIVGCNSDEGQMIYEAFVKKLVLHEKNLNEEVARNVMTNVLRMMWTVPDGEPVYKAIVDNYIQRGTQYSQEGLRRVMAECFGDFFFVIPTVKAAACHSREFL